MTKEDDYACKHDTVVLFGNGKWQCTLCMLEFRPAAEPLSAPSESQHVPSPAPADGGTPMGHEGAALKSGEGQ